MPKIRPDKYEKLEQMAIILRHDPHVSIRELAKRLGIPRSTAYDWKRWLEENKVIPTGSVILKWEPDSEPIFGYYEIYKSTSPNELGTLVKVIDDQSVSEVEVSSLFPGTTYYFTLKIYDKHGICYWRGEVSSS